MCTYCVCVHVWVCVCMCIFVCTCVCMCVHACGLWAIKMNFTRPLWHINHFALFKFTPKSTYLESSALDAVVSGHPMAAEKEEFKVGTEQRRERIQWREWIQWQVSNDKLRQWENFELLSATPGDCWSMAWKHPPWFLHYRLPAGRWRHRGRWRASYSDYYPQHVCSFKNHRLSLSHLKWWMLWSQPNNHDCFICYCF